MLYPAKCLYGSKEIMQSDEGAQAKNRILLHISSNKKMLEKITLRFQFSEEFSTAYLN